MLWNSIATGKLADKHGILGFVEPMPDGGGIRHVSSTSRRAKALWNILSQSGMRSSVVNWYASQPAEPINGAIFTNRYVSVTPEEPGKVPIHPYSVHPPALHEPAEDFRVHPHDLSLQQVMAFFPDRQPRDLTDPRMDKLIRILTETSTTHNAATFLAARDDWDLLAVYYDAIDHAGHQFVEYHPPAMTHVSAEDAEIYGAVFTGIYRFHDMMLGRLLELVGPETTVILLSDHGFYSDHLRPYVREHTRDPSEKIGPERNPTAWHRPQGVFVAAGQGIKRDELIHGATLLDIAPTILTLLGLPVADDMDGTVLTRIFQEPTEVARIASYEPPHPQDGMHRDVPAEDLDPWAARQALVQLAELGYITLPEDGDVTKMMADAEWDRRSNLAQVYFSSARPAEALEILQGLLELEEREHLRCRIALCLMSLGRTDEAEQMIASVNPAEAASPLPRFVHGQIKLAQDRTEEALALLEPLQNETLPLSHLHTVLGQAYLQKGLIHEAQAAFRKALERDDENAEAPDGLGVTLRKQKHYEDAVFEHTRSATLHHHRAQTHVNLGMALTLSHQYDWAIRAFTIAAELAPNNPVSHRWMAYIYRRIKKDEVNARAHMLAAVNLRRLLRARMKTEASRAVS